MPLPDGMKMKKILQLKMLMSVFILTSCMQPGVMLSPGETPQWLHSEPDMFPHFKYLSATGSASKTEQAKARALSNLAKIFEVQIREVATISTDIQTHKKYMAEKEGVETVAKSTRITSSINLKADKMVQGARIVEQWHNPVDMTYHALVVLDRTQAGNNIRQAMNRLDEETQHALNQQLQQKNVWLKIADLQQASALQQDRQSLQKTLKIIDIKGKGAVSRWNLAELNTQLQQALRSLPLTTVVKMDDTGGLHSIVQAAVANAGLNVTDKNNASSYQLVTSLVTQQPVIKDNWHWLRATLKVELIAEDGVTVIGHQSWPLKVSAGSTDQLQPRMLKAVDKTLKSELLHSMFTFAR